MTVVPGPAASAQQVTSVEQQATQELAKADTVRRVFARAALMTEWRVQTETGLVEGPLQLRTEDWLALGTSARIHYADVTGAWRRGRAIGTGAQWGAIVFGVVGGVGLGRDCANEGAEVDCNVPLAAAVGAAAGAVGGFLIGVAVGAIFPEWQERYP